MSACSRGAFAFAALCLLAAQPLCFGQAFTANLTGLVTDPAEAAVPGVNLKLVNTDTKEDRQTTSTGEGRYTFSQLLPGNYELTAGAPGFRTFVQRNINLVANQSAAVNFALQLGDMTQRVEVADSAVQLDTQTANQAATLNRDMVLSLPTNARNPMLLVYATAGVTAPTTGMTQSTADQNHDRFGFNGGRSTTTQILLDGVSVSAGNGWNGLIYSPSVDSVQEVQVIRNSYDAQFGRSGGGVVSLVTKGGGADFHGTAFEFLRNSDLDANSWENNRAGKARPIFQRNQFGGNISGPIWKSKKLFFFGGYEGLRQGSPSTSTLNLPTDQQKSGDFSNTYNSNGTLAVIYNPFSTRPNPSGSGYIRDAFPGNIIPASLIDPVGAKAVQLYPEPTGPGDPFTHARNYIATGKGTSVTDKSDIRMDWAHSEKHTMYGRFSKAFRENGLPPAGVFQSYTGTGPISGNPRYQMTIGNTFVPNPTWVINVLAGHGSWTEKQRSNTYGRDGTEIGLPASFVNQLDVKTIPQIYMTGYSNISHSRELNNISRVDNFQVNATKEKGVHSIKFGFGWESDKGTGGGLFSADFYFNRGMTSGPTASTDSTTSGDAIASMLLGTGQQGNVQKVALLATNRVSYSLYVQDSWRITKRLTLNPGLRYELQKPPTERYNRFSNFDYTVPNPLSQQVGLPLKGGLVFLNDKNRYSWNPDYKNFAPRIGLAYKITEKLVARAGYGIFFPAVLGTGDATGFSSTTPWQPSQGGDGVNPANLFRNPYPERPGSGDRKFPGTPDEPGPDGGFISAQPPQRLHAELQSRPAIRIGQEHGRGTWLRRKCWSQAFLWSDSEQQSIAGLAVEPRPSARSKSSESVLRDHHDGIAVQPHDSLQSAAPAVSGVRKREFQQRRTWRQFGVQRPARKSNQTVFERPDAPCELSVVEIHQQRSRDRAGPDRNGGYFP